MTAFSKLIETHCHLESLKSLPLEETLRLCQEQSIEKIITISAEPPSLDATLNIAQKYPQVFCSQGIHPHDAITYTKEIEEIIKVRSRQEKKVVAVGEIGLDYHYLHSSREKQIEVFESQLQIAVDSNLPVILHTREAEEDTIQILKNFSSSLKRKGVLHSFTSSLELLEFALSENFFIGFNGIITFKSAENVREALRQTPISNILLETDAPYLTPIPHRGKENSPFYLPLVAQAILKIKEGETLILETIFENSEKLFKI